MTVGTTIDMRTQMPCPLPFYPSTLLPFYPTTLLPFYPRYALTPPLPYSSGGQHDTLNPDLHQRYDPARW